MVCVGTGPSLSSEQVESAKRFTCFGCNNVWRLTELAVLYACNQQWWDYYWSPELAAYKAEKWTTNVAAAVTHGISLIGEKNKKGLSTDPEYVHHGHGSGYTLVNLAYLMGAERIVLLGYDMKYASDYNGYNCEVGSTPRHYFGEYPQELQHWPKLQVKNGIHVELLDLYRSIAKQGLVEVLNATPGSAIDCFRRVDIDAL